VTTDKQKGSIQYAPSSICDWLKKKKRRKKEICLLIQRRSRQNGVRINVKNSPVYACVRKKTGCVGEGKKRTKKSPIRHFFFSTLPLICVFLALDDDDDDDDYMKYSMGLLHSCLLLFSFFHGVDDTKKKKKLMKKL
jgi:hypothetical protein